MRSTPIYTSYNTPPSPTLCIVKPAWYRYSYIPDSERSFLVLVLGAVLLVVVAELAADSARYGKARVDIGEESLGVLLNLADLEA